MSHAKIATTRSTEVTGTISPYPMVVMVVVAQYTHAAYFAKRDRSSRSQAPPWVSASTSTASRRRPGVAIRGVIAVAPRRFDRRLLHGGRQEPRTACQCASVRTTHGDDLPRAVRRSAALEAGQRARDLQHAEQLQQPDELDDAHNPRPGTPRPREDVPARDAPGAAAPACMRRRVRRRARCRTRRRTRRPSRTRLCVRRGRRGRTARMPTRRAAPRFSCRAPRRGVEHDAPALARDVPGEIVEENVENNAAPRTVERVQGRARFHVHVAADGDAAGDRTHAVATTTATSHRRRNAKTGGSSTSASRSFRRRSSRTERRRSFRRDCRVSDAPRPRRGGPHRASAKRKKGAGFFPRGGARARRRGGHPAQPRAEHALRRERLAAQQDVPELGEERQRALRGPSLGFAQRVRSRLFIQSRDLRRAPRFLAGQTRLSERRTRRRARRGFVVGASGSRSDAGSLSSASSSGSHTASAGRSTSPSSSTIAAEAVWDPRRTPRRGNPRRSANRTRRFVLRCPRTRDEGRRGLPLPRVEARGPERGLGATRGVEARHLELGPDIDVASLAGHVLWSRARD